MPAWRKIRRKSLLAVSPLLLTVLMVFGASILRAGDDAQKPDLGKGDIKGLLRQSIQSGDENNLIELMKKLGKVPGNAAAAAVLAVADSLALEEETTYWFLLGGVSSFKRPEAFSEIGDFVVRSKGKPIARDLMNAIQQQENKNKYFVRIVRRVLEGCPTELQLMAVDLAGMIPCRRTVDVLMGCYETEDAKKQDPPRALEQRLIAALEGLTLKSYGDNYMNWRGWWDSNRHKGLKILRLEAEEQKSPTGVSQPLDPVRGREFVPESMPPGKVLVIRGPIAKNGVNTNNDHIENVLARMQVPHNVIDKTRVVDANVRLSDYAAIFINCTQIHPFCQSPGHQGGEAVGNRLHRCLGPNPHDNAHYGWWCGESCGTGGCSRDHPAILKLKKWVENGGVLFTEDWVLIELLEAAWPKLVTRGAKLQKQTVKIQPSKGIGSHPLLRGVFVPPVNLAGLEFEDEKEEEQFKKSYHPEDEDDPDDTSTSGTTGVDKEQPGGELIDEEVEVKRVEHTWAIDDESYAIDVKSNTVTILISSEELKKQCGQRAVAILIPAGKGRILHVLSHFGHQQSVRDEATIENLMINFLLELRVIQQ